MTKTKTVITIVNEKTGEKKTYVRESRWKWLHRIKFVFLAWGLLLRRRGWSFERIKTNDPLIYADLQRQRREKKSWKTKIELIY